MSEVQVEGATVGEVLRGACRRAPETEEQLFSTEGELNRYVNVYVNDEDVRVQDGLDDRRRARRHGRDPAGDGRRAP